MSFPRIIIFAVAALAVFGAAFGIGQAVGPIGTDDEADSHGHEASGDESPDEHEGHEAPMGPVASYELSVGEYTRGLIRFTVLDANGTPVTSYDEQHEKLLHLILVRDDLSDYHHVHPTLDEATGEWSVEADLGRGNWRAYADFLPAGGEATVATASLGIEPAPRAVPLGPDTSTATVDDYEVHLTREGSAIALHVTKDGQEVTDLEPYLGAYGHLVAIRAESLDYLHVHPEEGEAGPEVAFHAEFAEPGRYRLFFDFKHGGEVRTAVFTLTVGEQGEESGETEHGGGHDH